MKEYVCGFLFREGAEEAEVLLLQKNKPEWMKDKWNGIGGKIEAFESPLDAMKREFVEETGWIVDLDWHNFTILNGNEVELRDASNTIYRVHFYRAVLENQLIKYDKEKHIHQEEPSKFFGLSTLPAVLPNVPWLLKMAIWLPSYDCPMWLEEPGYRNALCQLENQEQSQPE